MDLEPAELSVPVSVDAAISEVVSGTFKIEGQLRLDGDALVFDYRTHGFRAGSGSAATVRLPLDALREAELKRRPRGAAIVVSPRRLEVLERVPGATPDALTFGVAAEDRERAGVLVGRLQRALRQADAPDALPFGLPSIHLGLTEVTGVLYLDDEFLVLEVGTGVSGGTAKTYRTVKIEPAALADVRLERGLVRDRLLLRPKTAELLAAMPGTHDGTLKLHLSKKHRPTAEHLAHEVRGRMSASEA